MDTDCCQRDSHGLHPETPSWRGRVRGRVGREGGGWVVVPRGGLEYLGRGGSTAYRGSSLPPDGIIRELPKTREVRRCLEGRYRAVFRRERCSNYVWKRFR